MTHDFLLFLRIILTEAVKKEPQYGSLGFLQGKIAQANSLPNTPAHSVTEKIPPKDRRISDTPGLKHLKTVVKPPESTDFEEESILDEEDSSSDDGISMMKKVPLAQDNKKRDV